MTLAAVFRIAFPVLITAIVFTPKPQRLCRLGTYVLAVANVRGRVPNQNQNHPAERPAFPTVEYLRRLRRVRHTVRILDTYPLPHAMEPRHRKRIQQSLVGVIAKGGQVQIILLHAKSQLVEQRFGAASPSRDQNAVDLPTSECYQVRIQQNMSDLYALRQKLDVGQRAAFQVRLIDSFPGITCYQCDDRVLTSFYPPNHLASSAPHLWVGKSSPIGTFVRSRFDNLWAYGEDLARHMFCEVRLSGDGASVLRETRFIERGTRHYFLFDDGAEKDRAVGLESIEVVLPGAQDRVPHRCQARQIPENPELLAELEDAFTAKYPGFGPASAIATQLAASCHG